ncbi:MAG TPA: SGNH/GDSL hydrolase family protein [Candidatus Dormibacteraeota bacterium]|nr:SGNH/GDSL hydrolase family protein [Candidatus Dormibacteraeota bacterium]
MRASLALQAGLLIASVVAAEGLLQLASRMSPTVERRLAPPWEVDQSVVPDERMVWRGNPLRPDHDRWGYRNPDRPARADVVALGDSQTYGPDDPSRAWPSVLARRAGLIVYNMALPGYGPGQSLLQLDDALSLDPKDLVVSVYFGNDLYDCFVLALRRSELTADPAAATPALRAEAEQLERRQSLRSERIQLFGAGEAGDPSTGASARSWASRHVQLYRLARALRYRLSTAPAINPMLSRDFARAAAAAAADSRHIVYPVEEGGWRTILSGPYRGQAQDARDPRIRLGFEIMREALARIAARARSARARLLVVLIPTKERVFVARVGVVDRYPGLREVVADETRWRRDLIADLLARDIDHLDVLGHLQAAPAQPYYEDVDGHPNEVGHEIIAAAVAERLAGAGRR